MQVCNQGQLWYSSQCTVQPIVISHGIQSSIHRFQLALYAIQYMQMDQHLFSVSGSHGILSLDVHSTILSILSLIFGRIEIEGFRIYSWLSYLKWWWCEQEPKIIYFLRKKKYNIENKVLGLILLYAYMTFPPSKKTKPRRGCNIFQYNEFGQNIVQIHCTKRCRMSFFLRREYLHILIYCIFFWIFQDIPENPCVRLSLFTGRLVLYLQGFILAATLSLRPCLRALTPRHAKRSSV